MLESRKDHTRERVTTSQKIKYIKWLTATIPERLETVEGKKRAWIRDDFEYQHGKLWKLPGRVFKERREVISEDLIWDTIIAVHNNFGHAGQNATASKVNNEYYGISTQEVHFLVKLCEICHRKAFSKPKGPLKSIVVTRLFERVQINLIDLSSTPDGEFK